HNTRRAGVHKTSRQSDQPFAFDLSSQRRAASRKDHEFGVQLEVVDFVQSHKAVDRPALFVVEREHDARERRMLTVQETVRGEMNDAVLVQPGIEYSLSTR